MSRAATPVAMILGTAGAMAAVLGFYWFTNQLGLGDDTVTLECVAREEQDPDWSVTRNAPLYPAQDRSTEPDATIAAGSVLYRTADGEGEWRQAACETREGTLEGWVHIGPEDDRAIVRWFEPTEAPIPPESEQPPDTDEQPPDTDEPPPDTDEQPPATGEDEESGTPAWVTGVLVIIGLALFFYGLYRVWLGDNGSASRSRG